MCACLTSVSALKVQRGSRHSLHSPPPPRSSLCKQADPQSDHHPGSRASRLALAVNPSRLTGETSPTSRQVNCQAQRRCCTEVGPWLPPPTDKALLFSSSCPASPPCPSGPSSTSAHSSVRQSGTQLRKAQTSRSCSSASKRLEAAVSLIWE